MKAFEKWWRKEFPEYSIESMGFQYDAEIWKAALEWVKTLNRKYWYESEYLEQDIEKELKDE